MARLFPVEGESAIAELWFDQAPWAQVELHGVQQDAVGQARVEGVQFKISLFPPPPDASSSWWEFDLAEVRSQLDAAEQWLLENEAGQALSKMAEDDVQQTIQPEQ